MFKNLLPLAFLFFSLNAFSQSFTSIWNTNNTSAQSPVDNEITIPTNPAYTNYNYTVDWGDTNTDTNVTGDITHTYASPGIYTVSISGDFPSIYFNNVNTSDKLKVIEITDWGIIQWQTMENAFYGCTKLNFDAIASPDLSQVTSLKNMFMGGALFNGIVNDWDVSNITNISGMFNGTSVFNRPLDKWDTRAITDMSDTFNGASQFNEPLDNWKPIAVTNMSGMFRAAGRFNQNINSWDVSQVTDMSKMFEWAGSFNSTVYNWEVGNVTDMSNMFSGTAFNHPLDRWDVSKVTNMSHMFSYGKFNDLIEGWNVSSVTDMSYMFHRHRTFNQPLNEWEVGNVTNMTSMFDGYIWGQIFNHPIEKWDVSKVTDMSYMFRDNSDFDQNIGGWTVSNVTNMKGMFKQTDAFNQDINGWDVSKVTDMSEMFQEAVLFNQPLNNWLVGAVTDMSSMFYFAEVFDQSLNDWDVDLVTSMSNMFRKNEVFNRPLNNWNTASVTNMSDMFESASNFDQNLASWNVGNITNMTEMLSNSGLSQTNYDNTLIGWATQTVKTNVALGATGLNYCDGRDARQELIDDFNWSITSDIINCSFVLCTNLISPINGDTNVPASANLTWAQTPGANGYYVTVRIIRGGVESIPFNDYDVVGGNIVGLNLENLSGDDLLEPGDEVFVTIVPYNNTDGPALGCAEESFTVVPSWVNSPDAFKLTFDTTLATAASTLASQLKIEANNGYPGNYVYNYSIDWGDDQFDNNVTDDITHTYLTPGIYTISIIGEYPSHYYYYSRPDNIKLTSIDQWGTQQWKSMNRAFFQCINMEYNATDVPDLSQVTDMSQMFTNAELFDGDINAWDVSNVTDMSYLFAENAIFNQPLENWEVGNVINMAGMFERAELFNQDIGGWNVGNVTNMDRMFDGFVYTLDFNQPLNDWDVSKVTNMRMMFRRTGDFDQPLDKWDVSSVTNMSYMFNSTTDFNGDISTWDVSNVTDMSYMFQQASAFDIDIDGWDVSSVILMNNMFASSTAFNQPLNSWDVDAVTNMSYMFQSAESFDRDINDWNVSEVTNMSYMFQNSVSFDQPLYEWNVSKVTNMQSMFNKAQVFNHDIEEWDVNSVVNMASMFQGAEAFDQPLNEWDVSAVANMSSMFQDALLFDRDLNSWIVTSVTLMPSMFEGAEKFNGEIGNWNVASVTTMKEMFKEAKVFDQEMQNWDTGAVITMEEMFKEATAFNRDINGWNVSFVRNMESMFEEASAFDQALGSWNVASVTTMEKMFKDAIAFNQLINDWNVRGVDTMREMFSGATAFDESINKWRVEGVTDLDYMFNGASSYNQPMNLWNLGTKSMRSTFNNATALDQSLEDWDVSAVSDMRDMLDNTALTRENYDATLIAWSEQTLTSGITLGAEGLPFCDAEEERQAMIDTYGWVFSGDVRDCPIPLCTQLASPLHDDFDVPVNTNLTWESSDYAKGYFLTVGTTSGGNDIEDNITVNDTSYEFTADFNTGDTIYVTITPFNDEGNPGICTEESFAISNELPTIPECTTLTEPILGPDDVVVTTDLSWNPISNADGYSLIIGTSEGANDILDAGDLGNVITYDLVTDLPENSDIFVTITPYNDQGDANCVSESFHTELIPVAPECTTLTIPSTLTDVAIDTNLSWTAVSNATGYLVKVGISSGGIEIANNIDVGLMTRFDFQDDLQEDRLYYVTIIPYNDVDDAMGCIEETFKTGSSTSPPSCTSLVTPAINAPEVLPGTNLTWTAVAKATGYNLAVGTSDGGTDIYTGDVGDTTTYDLISDLPTGATIFVTITPYNGNGEAKGCTSDSFTIKQLPSCTNLINPNEGAIDVGLDTNLTWSAASNATGYRLSVLASNSILNNVSDLDITSGTSYDFMNDFEPGETVTVTLIPYNEAGDNIDCATKGFTIKSLPACPNLSMPNNEAPDVSIDTNLEWIAIAGADGYKLSVTGSISSVNNLTDLDITSGNTYEFSNNFTQGETVTVTIVSYNDVGETTECSSESFTIESTPDCTNLSYPLAGAVLAEVNEISWNDVPDADGYKLTITGSNNTSNNITNFDTTGTTYAFPNEFTQGEVVTVTITPYNHLGDTEGCSSESFTIIPLPECTNLITPSSQSSPVSVGSDLTWAASNYTDGYRISVGTSANGTDIVDNEDVASLTSYTFAEDLPSETIIYVSIVPYNASGDTLGCSSDSFETEVVKPDCTSLISPYNEEINVSLESVITWNEVEKIDGYRISIGTTSGGNDIVDNQDLGLETSYFHNEEYPFNTEIFVSITPYNSAGDAADCESQSFTTMIPEDNTLYGFSPDGDGINEFWGIENISYHPVNVVTIYNRWGDAVFRIENYDNASKVFRGEANLKTKMGAGRLPSGTYFFNIQIEGTSTLAKTQGYLVIKR